jgi:hypothetical protein
MRASAALEKPTSVSLMGDAFFNETIAGLRSAGDARWR